MKTLNRIFYLLGLTFCLTNCTEQKVENKKIETSNRLISGKFDSLQKTLINNISFIGDTLLKGKKRLLENYLSRYQTDTCGIIIYQDTVLKSEFEGFKNLGDINNDKKNDTVFVIPTFNYCDDGNSYVFFDTTLPRLYTDSYCCHPDNLFSIGDIDEDGINEICIFYSSCTSRFKSLIAYSLKANKWKQIGRSLFDVGFMKPDKEKRVRKISKGEFEMLSIESIMQGGKFIGKKSWQKFTFIK